MSEIERIRWRCRRGMLELDLVLERFVERRYAGLDNGQRAAFNALLEMPDAVLWDMITGNAGLPLADSEQRALLEQIRAA